MAQTSDIQRQKALTLISILINNNSTITSTLHNLDSESIQFSEAETVYNEGLFYFIQATNLFNEEKFSEACTEAVVAMQKFKETLQLIENSGTIESVESVILAQEIINLKANISRTVEHVARLENLTQKAAKAGFDIVALDKKILEVKQYLKNVLGELCNSNLKGATEQLSIARTYLAEFDDMGGDSPEMVAGDVQDAKMQELIHMMTTSRKELDTPESVADAIVAKAEDMGVKNIGGDYDWVLKQVKKHWNH